MSIPGQARWVRLANHEAHELFRVPTEAVTAGGASFYELSTQPRTDPANDGPWPLLRIVVDPATPRAATIQGVTIDAEQLQWASFDPLFDASQYLLLDKKGLTALISLLNDLQAQLAPATAHEPPFVVLRPGELPAYRLDDEVFENHRQSFHLQRYDPLGEAAERAVIVLSAIHPLPAHWLYIGIRRVPRDANGGPVPGEVPAGPAFVNVDRHGVDYLIGVLTNELPHLAG